MVTLEGKKGRVVGIANEHGIASGCARSFREAGAVVAVNYLNDKARPYVEPVTKALDAPIFMLFDVEDSERLIMRGT